ncbi:MAG: hypothetical protein IPJ01_12510 [Micavibrio sp.]|nr:hypothetical protein [Micavibrio sp.]
MSRTKRKRWFIEQRSVSGKARFVKNIQDSQLTYTSERIAAMSFTCKEHAEVTFHILQRHLLLSTDIAVEAVEMEADAPAATKPEEGGWIIEREIVTSDGARFSRFFSALDDWTMLPELALRFARKRDIERLIDVFRATKHLSLKEWWDAKPRLLHPITPETDAVDRERMELQSHDAQLLSAAADVTAISIRNSAGTSITAEWCLKNGATRHRDENHGMGRQDNPSPGTKNSEFGFAEHDSQASPPASSCDIYWRH